MNLFITQNFVKHFFLNESIEHAKLTVSIYQKNGRMRQCKQNPNNFHQLTTNHDLQLLSTRQLSETNF